MPQRKFKEEYEMEDPWRYMADLPLEHVPTMRRVMLLIYHKLKPDEILFPRPELNWTFLTQAERKRVKTMLDETKDNDLLTEMLGWFSAKFTEEDEEVADAAQTLKTHVTYPVRQPKSYQTEYLIARKKWDMFLQQERDEDVSMGGMDGEGGLSTTPNLRPSEFITSVYEQRYIQRDPAQPLISARNSFNGTNPPVQPVFQPSYSFGTPNWREEICFKNAASAEVHFGNGSGERSSQKSRKRKKEEIEVPYSFTTGDEDASTESDPDDEEEVINIFQTEELPGRKTRRGTEFSSFAAPPTSKKQKISPGKLKGSFKRSKAPKTKAAPKTPPSKRRATQRSILADEDDDGVDDWEPENSKKQKTSVDKLRSSYNGSRAQKVKTAPETPRLKRSAAQKQSYVDEVDDEFDDWESDPPKQKTAPNKLNGSSDGSRTPKRQANPRTPPPRSRAAQRSSFLDDDDDDEDDEVDDWEPDTVWT